MVAIDTFAFLDYIKALPDYDGQVSHVEPLEPRTARFGTLKAPLAPWLETRLSPLGITRLYSHQADSVNHVRAGKNVMVATPSSSGKSLCYNIPVLEAILASPAVRALYLFPTKALAQDQLRGIRELTDSSFGATFDGDTPADERNSIKKKARVILSNPDMLHLGILPNHQVWSGFIHNLRFVVIDEAHIYRGVFGSHVANVLRRLRRLCQLYGASPQFILCSATIANPGEHAVGLVGLPFETVEQDGSPHGGRLFAFWNPPIIDELKATRRSTNSEASFLFAQLVRNRMRTLVFTRTRKLAELIYRYTRDRLGSVLSKRISPYRAGYLPEDRRHIEKEFFEGGLLGVVATSALELGINIGDLEATVLTGYPGSISSTWQQAGRSGRGARHALSILIAQNGPLDQYFMRHPDFFFKSNYESALIDPSNRYILDRHLLAAAWEKPLTDNDAALFGGSFHRAVDDKERSRQLRLRNGQWFPAASVRYPAQDIDIRSSSDSDYILVDTSCGYKVIETVSSAAALSQLHQGAIYFHQGEAYLVSRLDMAARTALAAPADVPYYTTARELSDIKINDTEQTKDVLGTQVFFGEVEVTSAVVGFKMKKQSTEEVIQDCPLDLPPQHFVTKALWFDLPEKGITAVERRKLDFHGAIHALEHAAIGMLPLFALCDRNDIGGVSTPLQPDTGKPQIFIYDAYPGGIGIAEKGYAVITSLWQATLNAVAECPCRHGCPACVQSPKCGNNNQPLDKAAAVILLRHLLGKAS